MYVNDNIFSLECAPLSIKITFMKYSSFHTSRNYERANNCMYLFNKHSARQTNLTPNASKPIYRHEFIKAFNTGN